MTGTTEAFSGKVALVTGGTRGIGAAIVRRFAKDGAAVAFTYQSSQERARQLVADVEANGGKAVAVQADSADAAAVQAAVLQITERLGKIDFFVNNAGISKFGNVETFPIEDLDEIIAVNLRAVFIGIQAAMKEMNDGGRIVTIGSVSAVRTGFPGYGAYSMTKAAVSALVRSAALELAGRNITVNNVQPGPIDTDLNPEEGPQAEFIKSIIPVKRFGHDHEVAALVAYLVGAESGYITGTDVSMDGGFLC